MSPSDLKSVWPGLHIGDTEDWLRVREFVERLIEWRAASRAVDWHAVQDMVQCSVMDILKRVRDPTSCLSSDGAYTLVLNTVRKSIRSHTRQRRQQPHSAGETGEIPRSFNSTFRAPTNWRQVHSALTTHLSSLEACVFWDTQVVQRSIRDVAGDVYGVPNVQSEQRVRRALSTARRKLRAHLDPDYLRALRLPESPPPIYASLCDHPSPPQSCWDTP